MSWFDLSIVALLIAAVISAAVKLFSGGRPHRAWILFLLRCAAATIVLLLFFQPTWRFSRLATTDQTVALLIDVSASMRLFSADSVSRAVVAQLDSAGVKTRIYAFGDSLRKTLSVDSCEFNDRASTLPANLDTGELAQVQSAILISDGNWSNAGVPRSLSRSKTIYYVDLPTLSPAPFLISAIGDYPRRIPADSASSATVSFQGYKEGSAPITVALRKRGKRITQRTIETGAGFFADTLALPLPASEAGTHVYEVIAESDDSLFSANYFVQQAIPSSYRVRMVGKRSLDRRFLRLAIAKRSNIELRERLPLDSIDAVLFFSWEDSTRAIFDRLPPHCSPAFIGALPCDSAPAVHFRNFRMTAEPGLFRRAIAAPFEQPPPPRSVYACPDARSQGLHIRETLLRASDGGARSTPLLFEATKNEKRILAFAAQGLWRWDFWPASLQRNDSGGRFSDLLLEALLQFIDRSANRSFRAYPERSPLYETDSIAFGFTLPADLQTAEQTSLRIAIIDSAGVAVFRDSTLLGLSEYPTASLAVTPLQAGSYRFEAVAKNRATNLRYSDSLRVLKANVERRVTGQNTVLLNQVAAPVSDLSAPPAALSGSGQNTVETVTRTVRITMIWPLLALLFFLLGLEWALRKAWRFER